MKDFDLKKEEQNRRVWKQWNKRHHGYNVCSALKALREEGLCPLDPWYVNAEQRALVNKKIDDVVGKEPDCMHPYAMTLYYIWRTRPSREFPIKRMSAATVYRFAVGDFVKEVKEDRFELTQEGQDFLKEQARKMFEKKEDDQREEVPPAPVVWPRKEGLLEKIRTFMGV